MPESHSSTEKRDTTFATEGDTSPFGVLNEKLKGVPHPTEREPRIRNHDHANCGDTCVEPPTLQKVIVAKDAEIERLRKIVRNAYDVLGEWAPLTPDVRDAINALKEGLA